MPTILEAPARTNRTACTPFPLTVGVEIECNFPSLNNLGNTTFLQRIHASAEEAGLKSIRTSRYRHDEIYRDHWHIGEDMSCGMEFRSPVFENAEDAKNQIQKICSVLSARNVTSNHHCGLHVHLGTGGKGSLAINKFHQYLYRNESTMMKLVPPNRRGNGYCEPMRLYNATEYLVRSIHNPTIPWSHRPWFHFSSHQTTEIRLQAGTVDGDKIYSWICLLQQLWLASQSARYDSQWKVLRAIDDTAPVIKKGFPSARVANLRTGALLHKGGNTPWVVEAKKYVSSFISSPNALTT